MGKESTITKAITQVSSQRWQNRVDRALEEYFLKQSNNSKNYEDTYQFLWQTIGQVSAGGKRIRPVLFYETFHAINSFEKITLQEKDLDSLAIAIELLHTAFIIHDDIIDGDTYRRDKLTVTGYFLEKYIENNKTNGKAMALADSASILAGDLLLTQAQRLFYLRNIDANIQVKIFQIYDKIVYSTVAGELFDVKYSTEKIGKVDLEQIIDMYYQKTAAYSFELPICLAATLACASEQNIKILEEFSRNIGIAYQLRDDYLGVFGDSKTTGKSVYSDIKSSKNTPLMIFASRTTYWNEISEIIDQENITSKDAEKIKTKLVQCGALSMLNNQIDYYTNKAEKSLLNIYQNDVLVKTLKPYLIPLTNRVK